jgi:Skp family chaperone for outer membrane proteins
MDMQMILRESTAVQAIEEQLDRQRAAHQAALKKKEVEVRRADKELARQRAILSSEAFAQKRLELEQQVSALQQDIQRRKRQLDQLFGQGMREVQKVLIDVAQEIAAERGADLVLSKATVVLVRPELDISQEALERLNATLPTITLPAAQN